MLTGYNDPAAAGGVRGQGQVLGAETGGVVTFAEYVGIFVLADAADEDGGVGRKDVLWENQ